MPMITVRILEGHSQETKQKIATGFMKTVTEATGLQPEDMWIVFEDVRLKDWFVGDKDCS
jgi:phenylpyruvate tautomerase PptA (4-oxalocrotonate tautomerase family)